MGYLSMGLMGLTILLLVFGFLFGLMRGLNRSILRLGLVIVSAVIAFLARDIIVDIVMDMDTGEGTVREMLLLSLATDSTGMPESIQAIVVALCEITIGLLGFYVLFIVLQFLTWLILFPILKIFVKKGEHKRALLGGAVGAVQGIVIAFLICSPLTGAISQVNRLASIEVDGAYIFEIPEEIGLNDFVKSPTYGLYNATGSWFFDSLTTTKTDDGTNISINDTIDITVAITGVADSVSKFQGAIEEMSKGGSMQEQIGALRNVGDALIEVDEKINGLSGNAKYLVNEVMGSMKDIVGSEGMDPELEKFLNEFDIESIDMASLGRAINGVASYIEKTDPEFGSHATVTQQEVNDIIGGFADNALLFDLILNSEESIEIVDIADQYEYLFEEAILSNNKLTERQKTKLLEAFGI